MNVFGRLYGISFCLTVIINPCLSVIHTTVEEKFRYIDNLALRLHDSRCHQDERLFGISAASLHYSVTQDRSFAINKSTNLDKYEVNYKYEAYENLNCNRFNITARFLLFSIYFYRC